MKKEAKYGIIKGDELIVYSSLHLGYNNGLSAVVSQQAKRILKEELDMKDVFSNHWDSKHGFSYEEAQKKKRDIDEQYGVGTPTSKWKPAVVEQDPERMDGYRIIIERKSED